jgi:hypothetical protein
MLFKEIITVYTESDTKATNTKSSPVRSKEDVEVLPTRPLPVEK